MATETGNLEFASMIENIQKGGNFYNNAVSRHLFSQFPIGFCKRLEPRTRKENADTALSFAVHDPLWMLTRQWQFGEFKGDDCGSAILAKIKVEKTEFGDIIYHPKDSGQARKTKFDRTQALEYVVERMEVEITPAVRVDSACYFRKMLASSALQPVAGAVCQYLLERFPLDNPLAPSGHPTGEPEKDITLREIRTSCNERLEQFMSSYGNRIFDGWKLFEACKKKVQLVADMRPAIGNRIPETGALMTEYAAWFMAHYPQEADQSSCWVDEKLGYEFALTVPDANNQGQSYALENYSTGHISWHAFDREKGKVYPLSDKAKRSTEMFTFIPTLAKFPDAPNKRLWKFEDARVSMGNSEMGSAALANAVILQFTTMYGNDWLLTPIDIEIGTITEVKGIIVTDVFGEWHYIDRPVGAETSPSTPYGSKWEMYTISNKHAYQHRDFTSDGRLFFPPSLAHTEESKPVEEVQFLRDEMANMLWGVENRINDQCGRSMDGADFATRVATKVDELNPASASDAAFAADMKEADYAYLLQNRVALNWIPFLPVKFKPDAAHAIREIRLQRAAMPLFVKKNFQPVRPCTHLLRTGINANDSVSLHRFINEEEIIGVGTKLMLTNQQTRWLNGRTFNWLGAKKQTSKSQANSGLQFDELIQKVKKSANKVN